MIARTMLPPPPGGSAPLDTTPYLPDLSHDTEPPPSGNPKSNSDYVLACLDEEERFILRRAHDMTREFAAPAACRLAHRIAFFEVAAEQFAGLR